MTWAELKAKVEKALEEKGQTEDIEIDYMDFNGSSSHVEAFVIEEFNFTCTKSLGWSLTVQ